MNNKAQQHENAGLCKTAAKRIGIDARFYGPVGKGLGRYTQEIVDNIIKVDASEGSSPAGGQAAQIQNEYVIFLRKENFDEFSSKNNNVKKVLADVRWYSLAEQIKMPWMIWKERLDLMHFPHFNVPIFCPAKFVVTIHDLILTKYPTIRASTLGPILYKIKNLAYKIIIWLAIKRAKKVIAVSKFTKNDIVSQFKARPDKIIVTYEGVANLAKGRDSLFAAKFDDKKTLLRYNIDSHFLLYVGNAYPHKNLEGLIKVFSTLTPSPRFASLAESKRAGEAGNPSPTRVHPALREERGKRERGDKENSLQLILVGKEDYFYKRIKDYAAKLGLWKENKIDTPVIFPGYVPDAQLEILFKKATAYVFPSLYEGFGLPPLEAMAKGCPVVSSDKTSMPEVLGDAAIYFNPDNEEEMQKQIELIIKDENLRDELIKKGYEQVKKYSWWECARKTLQIYNNI